jgi:hypothetical protein
MAASRLVQQSRRQRLYADGDVPDERAQITRQGCPAVPGPSKLPRPPPTIQAGNKGGPLQQQRLTMPRGPYDEA